VIISAQSINPLVFEVETQCASVFKETISLNNLDAFALRDVKMNT